MRHAIAMASILLSLAIAGWAQNFRGGINGIVTDQTGAVVPDAEVKATNEATGLVYTTSASTAGEFSFEDLPLGSFTIAVSKGGFATVTFTGVRVTAGTVYNLPVKLNVASTAAEVQVSAAALA